MKYATNRVALPRSARVIHRVLAECEEQEQPPISQDLLLLNVNTA